MAKNLREMRQARAKVITDARAVLEAAEAAKRALTAEEDVQWTALIEKSNELEAEISREERQQDMERELGQPAGEAQRPEPTGGESRGDPRSSKEYRAGYERFLKTGGIGAELRAIQMDNPESGGYLQAPLQMVSKLIEAVEDQVFMRQYGTTFQVTGAEGLGCPSLDADPEDGDWTGEISAVDEDTAMDFGRRELKPHPITKLVKVSQKSLRNVASVEDLVIRKLAYKFGVTQEKGFLTGNGAGQPLGVFTASNNGISTGRDVSTDNTATAMTADGLINAKYALKGNYWSRARWIFHREGLQQIAKLKDGEGQYLFNVDQGTLLGFPLHMSEYAPHIFTTLLYVGILGDFSNYWIADGLSLEIQRLNELYAATNQVGFIARAECDGMPVLEEAFVRVKLG